MGVYKVFNSTVLTLFFTEFTFTSFLTYEEPKTQISEHILNYSSSFLLDTNSFRFIVLGHPSSKLNNKNFARALYPGPPTEPVEGVTEQPDPLFGKVQNVFHFWLTI